MHDQRVDVCVIGLGASGLAAVRAARALGARVLGVDGGRMAGAASGRNGGLLLAGMAEFHHDLAAITGVAPATALYQHTLRALVDLRREHPDETWWPGSLRLADSETEHEDLAAQHRQMQADGLDVSWYEGTQGHGLLFPHDGACHPVRRALAMAERAEVEGAQLAEYSPVAHVETGGARLANGVHVTAPVILVCTDGALARLLPTIAPRVRPVRLQMCATAPAHDVQIPRPAYVRYGFDYWQQLADGRVLIGGGRDHFVAESFSSDETPSDGVQDWLTARLRETIGTQAPITHRWAATVTYTDPPLPIAESVADGVWGAGGYSGTGNVVGTLCGAGIARRALGVADAFLDSLDAARRAATTLAAPLLAIALGLTMLVQESFAQGGAPSPVGSTTAPPAQPSPAPAPLPQAPSPMVETTRAHERLEAREMPGTVRTVAGPSGREVSVYIAPAVRDTYDLVLHFHGAAWLAHQSTQTQEAPLASAAVNLGGGSGV
jgi:glycine/D-amino acid oxidase-like deaminating enzyme